MKCPNCGAELKINPDQEIRFCQYCGHKIEIVDEDPETMAGSVYRIGKSVVKEVSKHVEENKKYNRKRQEESSKYNLIFLIIGFLALLLLPFLFKYQ